MPVCLWRIHGMVIINTYVLPFVLLLAAQFLLGVYNNERGQLQRKICMSGTIFILPKHKALLSPTTFEVAEHNFISYLIAVSHEI